MLKLVKEGLVKHIKRHDAKMDSIRVRLVYFKVYISKPWEATSQIHPIQGVMLYTQHISIYL
jgi:hypothetical protein